MKMIAVLLAALLAPASAFRLTAASPIKTVSPRAPAPSLTTLPGPPALAVACILPTCLGYWKNGYAVSYAYGGAMAACGLLTLPSTKGLAALHACAYIFYGVRLNLFLLYRELCLDESVHQMVNRPADFKARLKRTPVVLGCSLLYFCMAAPLRVTATAATAGTSSAAAALAVAASFAGFGLAALGDLVKSICKKTQTSGQVNGVTKDTLTKELVTAFPFNFLRHPNYTGECLGWFASCAAAFSAAASAGALKASLGWLFASVVGTAGIFFVLMEAAGGLEKKQKEKYGSEPAYDAWVASTWAGPVLAKKTD